MDGMDREPSTAAWDFMDRSIQTEKGFGCVYLK